MKRFWFVVCCLASLLPVSSARGVVSNFTVSSAYSTLTLSGALSSGGTFLASLISQPGGGGLTQTYSGVIEADVNPATIQFLSAYLVAGSTGSWDPLPGGTTGLAPANYGTELAAGFLGGANLAVRNLSASLSSGVLALSGPLFSNQTFNGNVDATLLSATADYRAYGIVGSALGGGSITDGIAGQSGSFVSAGSFNSLTGQLTVPIDFDFSAIVAGADTTNSSDDIAVFINLSGGIISIVPEVSSLVLLGMVGSVAGFFGYRRQRKLSMSV